MHCGYASHEHDRRDGYLSNALEARTASATLGASNRSFRSALELTVILSAQLMVMLDFSIVNVALPSLQSAFGLSSSGGQWVVTAYAIAFGGLLILGGRAGDVFGRKRLFLAGLTCFSLASLVGGFAGSESLLVAARAAQGVGAALIAPNAFALLATRYEDGASRNRALGLYGATASVGFVAGLVLGGALVSWIGWRAVLWVNVPIGIAAAVGASCLLPQDGSRRDTRHLDVIGALLVTASTALLAWLPMAAAVFGWISAPFIGSTSLAAALIGALIIREQRFSNPLIRLGFLRSPTIAAANGVTLLFGAWNAGEVLILALVLQHARGYSALEAGLTSAPQGIAGFVAGLVGARFATRFGVRPLLLTTTGLAVVGHLLLSQVLVGGDPVELAIALVITGFGSGGTSLAATIAGSSGVASSDQGLTGGLLNSSRQIGAALGVAILMELALRVAGGRTAIDSAALISGSRLALYLAAGLAAAGFATSALFVSPARSPRST